MTDRVGNWMVTASGRAFYPLDPRSEEVDIEDIASALSKLCRFGGHLTCFYSVAQHCVLVSTIAQELDPSASPNVLLQALLHDAAEAYCGDVIWPVKQDPALKSAFGIIEARIEDAIWQRFGLGRDGVELVKHCDLVALATEKRDLVDSRGLLVTHANTALEAAAAKARTGRWHCDVVKPHKDWIFAEPPISAERMFKDRFRELNGADVMLSGRFVAANGED